MVEHPDSCGQDGGAAAVEGEHRQAELGMAQHRCGTEHPWHALCPVSRPHGGRRQMGVCWGTG